MNKHQEQQREQIDYWNSSGAALWIDEHAKMEKQFRQITETLLQKAACRIGESVLDIGCGCGSTTRELAALVGKDGKVVGLDVSTPMLDFARAQNSVHTIEYRLGDAAEYDFEVGRYDLHVSRFGVMFFGDPVAAFKNLHRSLKPDGRLVFACWTSLEENQWRNLPFQAICEHLPHLRSMATSGPGPFSFADKEQVSKILIAAGFQTPSFHKLETVFDIADSMGIDGALSDIKRSRTYAKPLADQPEDVRLAVEKTLRAKLQPFVQEQKVLLSASAWIVSC